MKLYQNNHAYIDAANLHFGVRNLGWELDYKKFRVWLRDQYFVEHAYLFLGYIPKYESLYGNLRQAGFSLIFKETVVGDLHPAKGNCDADLVLRVTIDTYEDEYDEAVIVSSDGDFSSLLDFLARRKRLKIVISPSNNCSWLIKKNKFPLMYIDEIGHKVSQGNKKRTPMETRLQ